MNASNNDDSDPTCLFCRWLASQLPVAAQGAVAALKDGHPVTEGHLLIVPFRHAADWLDLNQQERHDSHVLIRKLVNDIRRRDPSVSGFNLGTNIGASAGQTVFHAHIHLIPRRDGDMKEPKGGVRGVIPGKRSY